jgi:hypothetical protein
MTTLREQARELYAKALEANGAGWKNAANSIRAGHGNLWVQAGIAALERVLRTVPDEADDEGASG